MYSIHTNIIYEHEKSFTTEVDDQVWLTKSPTL